MLVQTLIEREYAVLLSHPIVRSVDLVRYTINRLDGYLRARCLLDNGDFLEVALHASMIGGTAIIDDYRYQWMDASRAVLRRRWDNTPHFPNLPDAPHHVHIGHEGIVEPSQPMNTAQLLDLLAGFIG